MYVMEYLIYHLRPYGHNKIQQCSNNGHKVHLQPKRSHISDDKNSEKSITSTTKHPSDLTFEVSNEGEKKEKVSIDDAGKTLYSTTGGGMEDVNTNVDNTRLYKQSG